MLTISRLAKRFGLSRSTLLYYDSIGLLSPSERSASNYRLYSESDIERMELIDIYREAGLPLADITRALSPGKDDLTGLLEARLRSLNEEIQKLRGQQRMIVHLMQNQVTRQETRTLDKDGWVAILKATGLSHEDMKRWHAEFERLFPEAHHDFLESLGIGEDEIARIRGWSKVTAASG